MSPFTFQDLKRYLRTGEHVCPWWFAYTFDNPLRRVIHRPETILGSHLREGMRAVDIGCGMGHFTLGMARLVGGRGEVVAVDLQQEMLEIVGRRAARVGLEGRVRLHRCSGERLGVEGDADFVLAFWMAHEVPDTPRFMAELFALLKPNGRFLLAEPVGHVSAARFEEIVTTARRAGFSTCGEPRISLSRAMLFARSVAAG